MIKNHTVELTAQRCKQYLMALIKVGKHSPFVKKQETGHIDRRIGIC